jgi:hypothetical protein
MMIAAMLVLGLGTAGCGSSSSKPKLTPRSAVTITKTEFVAKANVICGRAQPALSAATAKLAGHPSKAQVVAGVKGTFVPSIESQIVGIRALGTPPGDQATITRMLTLVQADLSKLKRNPGLIATDVFGDFAKVAHPYGLTACAPLS